MASRSGPPRKTPATAHDAILVTQHLDWRFTSLYRADPLDVLRFDRLASESFHVGSPAAETDEIRRRLSLVLLASAGLLPSGYHSPSSWRYCLSWLYSLSLLTTWQFLKELESPDRASDARSRRPGHTRTISSPPAPSVFTRPEGANERQSLLRRRSYGEYNGDTAGDAIPIPIAGGTVLGIHNLAIVFPQLIVGYPLMRSRHGSHYTCRNRSPWQPA
jgi:hypothetical protein